MAPAFTVDATAKDSAPPISMFRRTLRLLTLTAPAATMSGFDPVVPSVTSSFTPGSTLPDQFTGRFQSVPLPVGPPSQLMAAIS